MKSEFKVGDIVQVEGKGKMKFRLVAEYEYRSQEGWYMRDEEERHRVFPDSQIVR